MGQAYNNNLRLHRGALIKSSMNNCSWICNTVTMAMTTITKIATQIVESVVYGGLVENDVIPDKDDYFNFKQRAIQSKSEFGSILL